MKHVYLLVTALCLCVSTQAQYISLTQLPDNSCPTVCPGSTLVLEVYEVQDLNTGDTVQALFSNASGSFGSGTTTLNCTEYSLNLGSTWISGPYIFSTNVTNLYFEITIPANFPTGSNYTIEMKSSSGYVSSGLFRCSSSNAYINVTSAYATLASLPANSVGTDRWIGSVYTWNTDIPQGTLLNTPTLIDSVDFFDSANYEGYFLLDSLNFNINYQAATGGSCPGTPGTLNNGTSIPCSEGWSQFFSIRLECNENFPSGMYQLAIDGDDGIRLSIDGGNTWLLNTFYEEKYDTSYRSTAVQYPNGICLSGPTHLVIEYFQRYVDAILTFKDSLISSNSATINNPGNQSGCTGSDVAFNLNSNSGSLIYEWYYSTNGGSSFAPVPNSAPFSGVDSSTLHITGLPASYNNYLFQCEVSGVCSSPLTTPVDTLFVGGNGAPATLTGPQKPICANDSAQICAPDSCTSYLWNTGATTQCIYASEAGDYYATVTYNSGCTAESNHYSLRVYPVPSVSIIVSGDTLSSYGAVGYQWLLNNEDIQGATNPLYIAKQNGSYSLEITDTSGCTETSNPVNITTVAGINEVTADAFFSIYPNPVTDGSLIVVTAPQFEGQSLRLFDAEGRLVGNWIITSTRTALPLSPLARGVYFLKLEGGVRRVVRE